MDYRKWDDDTDVKPFQDYYSLSTAFDDDGDVRAVWIVHYSAYGPSILKAAEVVDYDDNFMDAFEASQDGWRVGSMKFHALFGADSAFSYQLFLHDMEPLCAIQLHNFFSKHKKGLDIDYEE